MKNQTLTAANSTQNALVELAGFISGAIYDGGIKAIVSAAGEADIKVTIVNDCSIHDNHICLHMQDHGFGNLAAARSYIQRQMQNIVPLDMEAAS